MSAVEMTEKSDYIQWQPQFNNHKTHNNQCHCCYARKITLIRKRMADSSTWLNNIGIHSLWRHTIALACQLLVKTKYTKL